MKANLELSIDHLILPDLPAVHRARVAVALEQELARLWAEQGPPPGVEAGERLALSASTIQVVAGARSDEIGAQVARSIYTSLVGGGGSLAGQEGVRNEH
jgi:hypothetical protein